MINKSLQNCKKAIKNAINKYSLCTIYQKVFLLYSFVVLLGITVFSFTSANWAFNSDTATANLLAEAMVREGRFFPKNWMYGQDIWVFFLHLPIALFTLISDNYLMMHSLAAVFFIFIAVIVCIYFSRKVLKSNAWIIAVPLLFCGISQESLFTTLGQCAYLPQLIFIFLAIPLFTESISENFKFKSKPLFLLLVLLIIFSGLSGIRNIQVIGLPLIGAIACVYFVENHNKSLKEIRPSIINIIFKIGFIGAAIIIGFLLYRLILANVMFSSGVLSYLSIASLEDLGQNALILISSFFTIFNYIPGANLFSVQGIMSMIGVLAAIMLGIVFPILQFLKYKDESFEVKFFLMFAAVHIVEIIIIFLFISFGATARYLLTVQFLLLFISSNYIYKYILPKINLFSTLTVALMLALFTFPQTFSHFKNVTDHENFMAGHLSIVEFLKDNDLSYGYATYWNAYKNTVFANGEVELNGILVHSVVEPYYWLNDVSRYTEEAYSGKTFLLLTQDENSTFINSSSYTDFGEPTAVLTHQGYVIYIYNYNIGRNEFKGFSVNHTVYDSNAEINNVYRTMSEKYQTEEAFYYSSFDHSVHPLNGDSVRVSAKEYGKKTLLLTNKDEFIKIPANLTTSFELMETFGDYDVYVSEITAFDMSSSLPNSGTEINLTAGTNIRTTNGSYNKYGFITDGSSSSYKLFGPYNETVTGTYRLTIYYDVIDYNDNYIGWFDVSLNNGTSILGSVDLSADADSVSIVATFPPDATFETRVFTHENAIVLIKYIEITRIS